MTAPDADLALPTDEQGGMLLCHLCRSWRPTEHVRTLKGTPTCTSCKPDHKLDPRPVEAPALDADRERIATGADRDRSAKPKRNRR